MADPVTAGLVIGGTVLSAASSYQQGRSQQDAARFEAAQLEDQARQRVIQGQLEAEEIRRIREIAMSDAKARMAADGGIDPQQQFQLGNLAGAYEKNALQNIYQASVDAATMRRGGEVRQFEGRVAKRAGTTGALTTALTGGAKVWELME